MKITIGIIDDHQLFLKSLSLLISSFPDFDIVVEALHGKDLIEKLEAKKIIPDILLIDVNMPVMDGPVTVKFLTEKYPAIKTVALSMKDDDATIIGMIKAGCCAYLLKDIHPTELEKALLEINTKGYYNADATNLSFRRVIQGKHTIPSLTEKEKEFLKLACTELTYKQIAARLYLSERTIDGYRETLFQKLKVRSRVGLVLEAIRQNMISL